jgi:hypothetical protein
VDGDELRKLLHRFESLKAPHHHNHLILRAFAKIWKVAFSGYDWSSAPLPTPRLELRPHLGSLRSSTAAVNLVASGGKKCILKSTSMR